MDDPSIKARKVLAPRQSQRDAIRRFWGDQRAWVVRKVVGGQMPNLDLYAQEKITFGNILRKGEPKNLRFKDKFPCPKCGHDLEIRLTKHQILLYCTGLTCDFKRTFYYQKVGK